MTPPPTETRIPLQRWGSGWITSTPYPVAASGPHQIIIEKTRDGYDALILPTHVAAERESALRQGQLL